MRRTHGIKYWLVPLSSLLLSANLAAGGNSRGITGYYQPLDVIHQGEAVKVTLSFRLFNFTSVDATHSDLVLRESRPPHSILGMVKNVSIRNGASTLVKGEFTVPGVEFDRWKRNGQLDLTLQIQNGDGTLQRQPVELKRGPTRNEE